MRGAHPRSRGENPTDATTDLATGGSSPLTRGKHGRRRDRSGARGLIPAHAGKTPGGKLTPTCRTAHPRSRGENRAPRTTRVIAAGSSPLTRGKLDSNVKDERRDRLIPAHAGKTGRRRPRSQKGQAHPRSRGENAGTSMEDMGAIGSSPLTRGKPLSLMVFISAFRLIPAHAGKTHCKDSCPWCVAAHPRSRGENRSAATARMSAVGSSPLTRGKLPRELVDVISERLIPAHAGKTRPCPHPGEA